MSDTFAPEQVFATVQLEGLRRALNREQVEALADPFGSQGWRRSNGDTQVRGR